MDDRFPGCRVERAAGDAFDAYRRFSPDGQILHPYVLRQLTQRRQRVPRWDT